MEHIKGLDNYKTDNNFHNESEQQTYTFNHVEPIDLSTSHPGCTKSDVRIILTAELEHILFGLKIVMKGESNYIKAHITGWYVDYTEDDIIDKINDIIIDKIQY